MKVELGFLTGSFPKQSSNQTSKLSLCLLKYSARPLRMWPIPWCLEEIAQKRDRCYLKKMQLWEPMVSSLVIRGNVTMRKSIVYNSIKVAVEILTKAHSASLVCFPFLIRHRWMQGNPSDLWAERRLQQPAGNVSLRVSWRLPVR